MKPDRAIVFEVCGNTQFDWLMALVNNTHFASLTATSICASPTEIKRVLAKTNDGNAVFLDVTDIIGNGKVERGVSSLVEDLRHASGDNSNAEHQVIVLTSAAGEKYNAQNFLTLSFDNSPNNVEVKRIQQLVSELCSVVVQVTACHYTEMVAEINRFVDNFRIQVPEIKTSKYAANILIYGAIIKIFFYPEYISGEKFNRILKWAESAEESINAQMQIINEFSAAVNTMMRDEAITLVTDAKNTPFLQGESMVLIKSNTICLEEKTLEELIIPRMKSTSRIDTILDAIKGYGMLVATNKNRRPLNVYDTNGIGSSIPFFSIKTEILDLDNLQMIEQLPFEEYFFKPEQIDDKAFLPLLVSFDGRLAGIRFDRYADNHMFITGQSGYGKTTLLARIIASRAYMGHRVVVFDCSGAFSDEEQAKLFPRRFR